MRDWMVKLREDRGMSLRDMAILCNISYRLMCGLEELDWITSPYIADMVAAGYGMNVVQRNALCAKKHHVEKLALPRTYLERHKGGNAPELFVEVNVPCIQFLMANTGMNVGSVSNRMTYSSTWLHACLKRGTMKPSDIRRLARILEVSPEQLKATRT